MNGIAAFTSYKNKYPNSFFEEVGDALLTPIPTLCQRNSYVVLKNEETGARCIYTYTNDSKSSWRVAAEVVASVATLPLALVGMVFKGLSLVTSPETRDIYTNWQTPLQPQFGNPDKIQDNEINGNGLKQRARNLTKLTEFAVAKGCAPQLLHELIHHPQEYMVATYDNISGDHVWLPPYLNECACVNSGNFNRFKNQRRTNLETQLVTDAVESFPPSEHFKLNYIGFGAGELLQDFINVGKLIEAGYSDLNIILIDPKLKEEIVDVKNGERISNPTLEQFKFLLEVAKQKGIKFQIQVFKNITEYRHAFPDEKAHCISAIDFDDYQKAFNDVTLCHQVLHDKGKFYLSYGIHDLCFTSTQCIRNSQHGEQDPLYLSIFDDFQNDVRLLSQKLSQKGQKVARYAQLGTEHNFEEWTRLLPELAKCGCDKIEFMLMHPPERNFFGNPLAEPNAQFTKENLEYYLKLFLPAETNIEVQLIKSIDSFKEYVETSQAKFDMVTWCGHTTDDEQTAKANIRWLRQHAVDSNIYYGVQVYKRDAKRKLALSFEGMWRWNADSGIKHLLPSKPEHQAVVDELMEERQVILLKDSGKKYATQH